MKQLFLLFVFMMSLSACSRDTHNHPSNITNKELFEDHCVACHAPGGTGSILLGAPSNKDTKMLNIQIRKKIREGSGVGVIAQCLYFIICRLKKQVELSVTFARCRRMIINNVN